jgi:transposase
VRGVSLWRSVLGVGKKTVVERVVEDEAAGVVVVHVRPVKGERGRCGICRCRCPGYDGGSGRRRWRALDAGAVRVFCEAEAPRVRCAEHGVVVAAVPWARHGAGHTRGFDDQVAWLAVVCSKVAVTRLMRIAWRTVGAIVERVCAETDARVDRFAGLRRIGIDEISYRRGYRYLTVVVDHDTGLLVWAADGRSERTLRGFFEVLGAERCQNITHVSADGAGYIAKVVTACCPQAVRCIDAFHVISWATSALDEVRRQVWRQASSELGRRQNGAIRRPRGHSDAHRRIKRSRWALWKNPENLTKPQADKLAWIAKTHPRLHRAYLLKEGLRHVFKTAADPAQALDCWLAWAQRCRIEVFVELGRKIKRHRSEIEATVTHRLSNALVESVNTKIRLITRMAFGFHTPDALIAMAMLALGGYRPTLPGR